MSNVQQQHCKDILKLQQQEDCAYPQNAVTNIQDPSNTGSSLHFLTHTRCYSKCVVKKRVTIVALVCGIPVLMKPTVYFMLFNKPIGMGAFHTLFGKSHADVQDDSRHFLLGRNELTQILGLNLDRFNFSKLMKGEIERKKMVPKKVPPQTSVPSDVCTPSGAEVSGKKRPRDPECHKGGNGCCSRRFKDDISILNLRTNNPKGEYSVCSVSGLFTCKCQKRIHRISEDKRGVLELCPQYLPGRTYYIYGFGRYAPYPKKTKEGASCSKQCLIASLDGHMMFIDADLIAAIKFFNEMSPIELGYFDDLSITRDFTNVPCLSKDYQEYPVPLNLVKSVFTPVPAPKLPDGFLRWYGNCTLRLNGDEALLRHRPLPPTWKIVITDPIRYNNKSKKARTTSELTTNPSAMQFFQLFNPNPAVPPFILGIPSQEGFPRRYNLPSMLVPTTRSVPGSTTTDSPSLPATAPPQESSMWQRNL